MTLEIQTASEANHKEFYIRSQNNVNFYFTDVLLTGYYPWRQPRSQGL